MSELQKIRIDKWLWAVRLVKTRTMATNLCNSGKVKINGKSVKPSYSLMVDETIHFSYYGNKKIIEVKMLLAKRTSAAIASECYVDLSPPPIERNNLDSAFYNFEIRDKGVGRPTKKERRAIDEFKQNSND
ncbi:MAG: RNA-binding S4 domain-containing protein [Chitinophagales bacterium]|nr:RNA-binding S4 domain-containing protein [Chitinophagales bacterium]